MYRKISLNHHIVISYIGYYILINTFIYICLNQLWGPLVHELQQGKQHSWINGKECIRCGILWSLRKICMQFLQQNFHEFSLKEGNSLQILATKLHVSDNFTCCHYRSPRYMASMMPLPYQQKSSFHRTATIWNPVGGNIFVSQFAICNVMSSQKKQKLTSTYMLEAWSHTKTMNFISTV